MSVLPVIVFDWRREDGDLGRGRRGFGRDGDHLLGAAQIHGHAVGFGSFSGRVGRNSCIFGRRADREFLTRGSISANHKPHVQATFILKCSLPCVRQRVCEGHHPHFQKNPTYRSILGRGS